MKKPCASMEINYRQGQADDIPEISRLVGKAIDQMEKNGILQWDELYPTDEDFAEDIQNGQLTVGCIAGQIAVVFTVNQKCEAEYADGKWKEPESPFTVLHRLCVNPDFQNRGIAKQTMQYIEERVLAEGKQAVRLDVYSGNPHAIKLYLHCGYQKVGSVQWRKGVFYLMEKYLKYDV